MRLFLPIIIALLSFFGWRNGRTVKNIMLFNTPLPAGYYAGGNVSTQCTTLKDEYDTFKFCEDAVFWDLRDAKGRLGERRVLLSCDPNRRQWNTVLGPLHNPEPRGSLWIYSPKLKRRTPGSKNVLPADKPQRLVLKDYPRGHDFHPLGFDIYPSYNGNASNLYVVNHARQRTYIEHFTLLPEGPTVAQHVRTLSSPYFISPNSIALTSPSSFYVTNDHLITRRLPYVGHVLPLIETLLGLPLAFVSHVELDPSPKATTPILSHSFKAPFIPFPNGVAVSPSGLEVAVASSSMTFVQLYSRDPKTNSLSLKHTIQVPFAPDNLGYDEDGTLIVAGHPFFPTVIDLAAGKVPVAPSWIVAIRPVAGEPLDTPVEQFDLLAPVSASQKVPAVKSHIIETVFQSDGQVFSSSTTGLRDSVSGALFASGLYAEQGMLLCIPV